MSQSVRFSLEFFVFAACFLIASLANLVPNSFAFVVTLSVLLMWTLHRRAAQEKSSSRTLPEIRRDLTGSPCLTSFESKQHRTEFDLSIGPNGSGSFSLYMHTKSRAGHAVGLIGQWKTIEQTQKVAAQIHHRLLCDGKTSVPGLREIGQGQRAAE